MGNGGRPNGYKAAEFIAAIPGTGGIISTIAARVGCDWRTAKRYIETMPTVQAVYDDENERIIDTAEGVLIGNIQAAVKKQQVAQRNGKPAIVDSADAKWYLTRKGKGRGYVERQEISGKDGGNLKVEYVNDWRNVAD